MTNHSVASILGQINASMIYLPSKYDQEICPSSFAKLEIGGNNNICMGVDHCSTSGVNFLLCFRFAGCSIQMKIMLSLKQKILLPLQLTDIKCCQCVSMWSYQWQFCYSAAYFHPPFIP